MDKYAVIGNPVAHSRSPQIHEAFARATGQGLTYERVLAPLDGFVPTVAAFANSGGQGLNVTVPFKLEAFALTATRSTRAQLAGAVNTLKRVDGDWHGDNTDGPGIVRDITRNLGFALAARDILVLGAGGASRGIMSSVLAEGPRSLAISNRTFAKATAIAELFAPYGPICAVSPDALAGRSFDIVINATSAGQSDLSPPPWPASIMASGAFAYDLIYADTPTPFRCWAKANGSTRTADGLGMLVEQAAESFFIWRGVRPDTAPIFSLLRRSGRG
ncbi:MAG: shikimate dehydrogenase [Betaproteobacteria bacterium]